MNRLSPEEREAAAALGASWSFRAPEDYLARVDWSRPDDPLRRQVVPDLGELRRQPEDLDDPIGDERHSPAPRLVHRYPHRALLLPTEDCPVHCRFCFRRARLGGAPAGFSREALAPALDYLAAHTEVREVVLTGGEPLSLAPDELAWLHARLLAIPHVQLLRIHTRLPVVAPSALRDEHLRALGGERLPWLVLHVNHPHELGPEVSATLARLRAAGFPLLSQSVLLAGVNDDEAVLAALFETLLYEHGVRPYYLHHCDRAPGAAHLRVPLARGRALVEALRARLSGLALPRYVLDLPGGDGKVSAEGPGLVEEKPGVWRVADREGVERVYRED